MVWLRYYERRNRLAGAAPPEDLIFINSVVTFDGENYVFHARPPFSKGCSVSPEAGSPVSRLWLFLMRRAQCTKCWPLCARKHFREKPMPSSHLQYLPIPWPVYVFLLGALAIIAALVQIGLIRYVYARLGISPLAAL